MDEIRPRMVFLGGTMLRSMSAFTFVLDPFYFLRLTAEGEFFMTSEYLASYVA